MHIMLLKKKEVNLVKMMTVIFTFHVGLEQQ